MFRPFDTRVSMPGGSHRVVVPYAVFLERREQRCRVATALSDAEGEDPAPGGVAAQMPVVHQLLLAVSEKGDPS
jgi:hypothetical protein